MATCKISIETEPLLNGTVAGSGVVTVGDTVTLTPKPNKNKYFLDWRLPNGSISTANPLSFTASADATYKANFKPYFSVKVNQTGGGSATGETFVAKEADTVTLEATTDSGYAFVGWFENGNLVSTNTRYAFKTNMDRVITPRYEISGVKTSIATMVPKLTLLTSLKAVTNAFVQAGEIKTSGVRKAIFYVDVVHTDSTNVRIKFLAKPTSGGVGYSFVTLTPTAGVEAVDQQYFELNTDATQSFVLELMLNEEVAFLGVLIEAGTVGTTADTVTINYALKQ